MSTPELGRNERLFKDGVVIGYAKDISVKALANLIKEYSMDSLTPAYTRRGSRLSFGARAFNGMQLFLDTIVLAF